jgi:hypothetical protein
MPLVGRRGSVRSGRGRAVRGDGVLGTDVGAGAVGPAVVVVPRRLGPARGAVWRLPVRDVAQERVPMRNHFRVSLFDCCSLQKVEPKCTKVCIGKL